MKNLKNGVMHFHVTINGVNYWGNYTPETFDFYLNSDNGVLGYTDGDRAVGNWYYDEVVSLVETGQFPSPSGEIGRASCRERV